MRVKIILTVVTVICFNLLVSQNIGFMGKKNTVELTTDFGVFPYFTGYAHYRLKTNPVRGNISFSRSLGRRVSISADYSFGKANARYSSKPIIKEFGEGLFERKNKDYNYFEKTSYSGFGVQFNFFTNAEIAPIGRSFFIYIKGNRISSKEFHYSEVSIDSNYNFVFERQVDEVKISFGTVGIGISNVSFFNSKSPLYLSYSIRMGLPFNIVEKLGDNAFPSDGPRYYSDLSAFRKHFTYHDFLELSLGVGYVF